MFVIVEVELVLPLPVVVVPDWSSKTAVPGTSLVVRAARASEAPIEQRRKPRNIRTLNAPDSEDEVFRILNSAD